MDEDLVRARAVVRGRVQMVGFRAFIVRHARDADVRGMVRNARDGTLECTVEGPRRAVERVLQALSKGPVSARVDRVDVEYLAPAGDLPPMSVMA